MIGAETDEGTILLRKKNIKEESSILLQIQLKLSISSIQLVERKLISKMELEQSSDHSNRLKLAQTGSH